MALWIFTVVLVGVSDAAAQQTPTQPSSQIPPVVNVITVSAQAIPLEMAPATVSVITRDFIESAHAESFADLIRQIPNLYLSQTGQGGGLTTITIRGGKPNFTFVLIDGIPLNDIGNILGGSFDFSSLSPDNIERIEIVSGPFSSLYGSEAVGGVINIISRSGPPPRSIDAGGEFGGFGTRQGRLSVNETVAQFPFSLSGSYLTEGPQVGGGNYSLGTVAFRSSRNLGQSKVLQLLIRFDDKASSGFPANGGGPEYSILRQLKTDHARELVSGLTFGHQVNSHWYYTLDGDFYLRIDDSFTPPILDAVPPTAKSVPSELTHETFTRARVAFSNVFSFNPHISADFRVRFEDERGMDDGFISGSIPDNFGSVRPTLYATGGLLVKSGRLTATAGLGVERSTSFTSISPRIGFSYRVGPSEMRLKASWGTGFSLPSFEALGDPIVGNRSLQPESSRGLDAGVEGTIKRVDMKYSLKYYWNSYKDLIDFSPEQFRLVNRSSALTQGFEWNTSFSPIHRLAVDGQLTLLSARLVGSTDHLRDLPKWRGGFGIEWKVTTRIRSRLETLWVSRRYDFQVPIPDVQTVPDYTTTSLVVSYALTSRSDFYLRVDNLWDSHFQEFLGFPNGGIYARIGVNIKLLKPTGTGF
jgi:outer membrane cobalamin receptor